MSNEDNSKTILNNSNNQKTSSWNMQFLEKKRQQLRQQHEKRKKAEQTAHEQLKPRQITRQQQIFNRSKHQPINIIQPPIASFDQLKFNRNNHASNNLHSHIIEAQSQAKKIGQDQILRDGKILKVIERTLSHDEYKVQCLYEDQMVQLIATKDEIVRNNIIPLLDYYEKTLGLR